MYQDQSPGYANPAIRIREYEKLKARTRKKFVIVMAFIVLFTAFLTWHLAYVVGLLPQYDWANMTVIYAILAVLAALYFRGLYLIVRGDYTLMRKRISEINWGIYLEKQYLNQRHETV